MLSKIVPMELSNEDPLNREPPVKDLVSSFLTTKGGYDRNHGPIPHLQAETHIVHVDGAVKQGIEFSIPQLRNDFEQYSVTCALQCAGNRRHTMRTLLKEVQGIDWGDGAVMNCRWRGPKLRDVLMRADVTAADPNKFHVAFACLQTKTQDDDWYGGSIELWRALKEGANVIIALEMNGTPLTPEHGFPARVIVPGVAGARSVKWLDRITVQAEESPNFYQQHDYKILPPDAVDQESAAKYWDITPALMDMPINSVIASPQHGDELNLGEDGMAEIKGYALPQADQGPVVRVEVSVDGGKGWVDAELWSGCDGEGGSKWCWVLWKASVKLERGRTCHVMCRATDKGGNVQCKCPQWNLRGVGYNGYGESRDVRVI